MCIVPTRVRACFFAYKLQYFIHNARGFGFQFSASFVCLLAFHTISQKPMQLGTSNVTQKCSTISTGNIFILRSMKTVPAWGLHSCDCWVLLVKYFAYIIHYINIYTVLLPVLSRLLITSINTTLFNFLK